MDRLDHFPRVWCPTCNKVQRLIFDVLKANDKNEHDAADIVCAECKSIIATLHNDSLPRLRLSDFEKTDIGGHPRHTEDTERGRDRRHLRIELAQSRAIRERVFLPAAIAENDIANRVFWIARLDNFSDRAANHRVPDGGVAYDFAAFMRPRMYGSSER